MRLQVLTATYKKVTVFWDEAASQKTVIFKVVLDFYNYTIWDILQREYVNSDLQQAYLVAAFALLSIRIFRTEVEYIQYTCEWGPSTCLSFSSVSPFTTLRTSLECVMEQSAFRLSVTYCCQLFSDQFCFIETASCCFWPVLLLRGMQSATVSSVNTVTVLHCSSKEFREIHGLWDFSRVTHVDWRLKDSHVSTYNWNYVCVY
jgi:hypothetical protein